MHRDLEKNLLTRSSLQLLQSPAVGVLVHAGRACIGKHSKDYKPNQVAGLCFFLCSSR